MVYIQYRGCEVRFTDKKKKKKWSGIIGIKNEHFVKKFQTKKGEMQGYSFSPKRGA